MKEKLNNLVIGIYYHPEAYPPTLNAINELSDCYKDIAVVHRPLLQSNWSYPDNVATFTKGMQMSETEQQQSSLPKKILYFINYTLLFLKIIIRYKPMMILVYDNISLFSYHLLRPFIRHHHYVWYHNHDVVELTGQRKYSIGWFALQSEKKSFDYLSVFTLPTDDRLVYFNLSGFKGRYFCIPNFPSKKVYQPWKTTDHLPSCISLIFQGSMDNSHGIEEILPVLKEKVSGRECILKLVGKSMPGYKESIDQLSAMYHVQGKVQFDGLQPYKKMPELSSSCHIGMAIYTKQDVMARTISTASNKIYEYAAVGLPVLSFDNEYYRKHLSKYSWIFFTDCSADSYRETLTSITSQYQEVSMAARKDFLDYLNFETIFKQVKDYITILP